MRPQRRSVPDGRNRPAAIGPLRNAGSRHWQRCLSDNGSGHFDFRQVSVRQTCGRRIHPLGQGRQREVTVRSRKQRAKPASTRRNPSSLRTMDCELFAGPSIKPFRQSRSRVFQSNPFQARLSSCSVSHSSPRMAPLIFSTSSFSAAATLSGPPAC